MKKIFGLIMSIVLEDTLGDGSGGAAGRPRPGDPALDPPPAGLVGHLPEGRPHHPRPAPLRRGAGPPLVPPRPVPAVGLGGPAGAGAARRLQPPLRRLLLR